MKFLKIYVPLAALILGILFDYLFFDRYPGISVLVFALVLVGAVIAMAVYRKLTLRPVLWLMLLVLFFSSMVAVRASGFLTVLNVIASIGLLLLIASVFVDRPLKDFGIVNYLSALFIAPFMMIERGFNAAALALKPERKDSSRTGRLVLKGVLMALPFLVFFSIMFAGADAAFKNFLTTVFSFDMPENLFGHILTAVGAAFGCLGILAFIFNPVPKGEKASEAAEEKIIPERKVETRIFLWLIVGLFFIFIIFQVAYLFGGAVNIGNDGFTYAEYARKGFWELLTVSIVSLFVLLMMDFYTRRSQDRLSWFTIPSVVMIGEIFIIIASALKRMMLYQAAYDWTTLRLYVSGFIIFLAVVFTVLAVKLITKKRHNFFAFGVLLSMIAYLVCFNMLNPDRFIARQNIQRFNETGKIDVPYLGTMSADATSEALGIYDRLSEDEKTQLYIRLKEKIGYHRDQADGWQSYNYSRASSFQQLSDFFAGRDFLDRAWKYPVMKDVSSVLKQHEDEDITFYSHDSDHLSWTKDGYTVHLSKADSINIEYCGLPEHIMNGQTKDMYDVASLGEVHRKISDTIVGNTYVLNSENTTKLGDYDFIQGYQKDGILCRLELSGAVSGCSTDRTQRSVDMTLTCSSGLDQALAEQKRFIDLLEFRGKNTSAYEVKRHGDFILLGSTAEIGGAAYIVKDTKGKLEVLIGPWQEEWYCDDMEELKIPKEIYGECYAS